MSKTEVFSFRVSEKVAEDVRIYARKRYGQKAGSIIKFVTDALVNEINIEKAKE